MCGAEWLNPILFEAAHIESFGCHVVASFWVAFIWVGTISKWITKNKIALLRKRTIQLYSTGVDFCFVLFSLFISFSRMEISLCGTNQSKINFGFCVFVEHSVCRKHDNPPPLCYFNFHSTLFRIWKLHKTDQHWFGMFSPQTSPTLPFPLPLSLQTTIVNVATIAFAVLCYDNLNVNRIIN